MFALSYFDRLLQDKKVLQHPAVHLLCPNNTYTMLFVLFCSLGYVIVAMKEFANGFGTGNCKLYNQQLHSLTKYSTLKLTYPVVYM